MSWPGIEGRVATPEEGECREYSTDGQRSDKGCTVARMQQYLADGTPGLPDPKGSCSH